MLFAIFLEFISEFEVQDKQGATNQEYYDLNLIIELKILAYQSCPHGVASDGLGDSLKSRIND